ncbi:MAG: hypothetical protein LBU65_08600 [Planctomycetaceae bacterium]|jgi:hypothetical protein|nr:hypothetical protein [Planctomycetaceae bacterium]
MLIFKINAGLGNQMFQYAAGRALSLRYGCEFRIDTREVGKTHPGIGIKAFNITAKDKQVIAPYPWFLPTTRHRRCGYHSKYIYPSDWIKLD